MLLEYLASEAKYCNSRFFSIIRGNIMNLKAFAKLNLICQL